MTDAVHVLCAQPLNDDHLQLLQRVSPRLVINTVASSGDSDDALTPDTEILFASRANFALARAPGLRWMQTQSAGVDHLIDTPVWHSDITITSANGVHAVQLAEYVLAMLLAHGHHLPELYRLQRERRWADDGDRFTPRELRGATVGIIGYGAIGREVARLARAFGMRVLATARNVDGPHAFDGWTPPGTGDADGTVPERFFTLDQLPDMLPQCDAVVLAIPLAPRTRHVLNPDTLALLPPHAVIVNIGRGGLIDHDALRDALQREQIGGAALDVTEPEPLPAGDALWTLPNVIITPHIGGLSPHYADRAVAVFAENLRRYVAGEPLINVVDRAQGY